MTTKDTKDTKDTKGRGQIKAFFQDTRRGITLCRGDCRKVLATLPAESIDACVCDPPYDLTSGKRGGSGPASLNTSSPAGLSRVTTGFMGKTWDGTGVAFDPATWAEVLRVLKPGAHLLAFGGTRTYHRMATAIEDAGFEIRDCVMWIYGQGFPKSLDVSKAIDKRNGHPRQRIRGVRSGVVAGTYAQDAWSKEFKDSVLSSDPITPAARQWQGYGTALKPAYEPIIVARKPVAGTIVDNVLKHGTGALNIDATRVGTTEAICAHYGTNGAAGHTFGNRQEYVPGIAGTVFNTQGRFPSNLILSHHPECRKVGTKKVKSSVAGAPQQLKTSKGCKGRAWANDASRHPEGHPVNEGLEKPGYADADGLETVDDYVCHPDCPMKLFPETGPSRSGGVAGWQDKYVGGTYSRIERTGYDEAPGSAARFFYCAKTSRKERGEGNTHPTVKPQSLMRYLVRLVTPPGGLVLDPFLGSGSTALAAIAEGFCILGIEQDAGYLRIAKRRLANT